MRRSTIAIIGLFFVVLLCPTSRTINAYQNMLWTFPPQDSGGRHDKRDWYYSNGVAVRGLVGWNRLQLGFPTKPVTIDRRSSEGAVQVCIEWGIVYFNLLCWAVCSAAFVVITRLGPRFAWKFAGPHPEPDNR